MSIEDIANIVTIISLPISIISLFISSSILYKINININNDKIETNNANKNKGSTINQINNRS